MVNGSFWFETYEITEDPCLKGSFTWFRAPSLHLKTSNDFWTNNLSLLLFLSGGKKCGMGLTHALTQEVLIALNLSQILFICYRGFLWSPRSSLSMIGQQIHDKAEPSNTYILRLSSHIILNLITSSSLLCLQWLEIVTSPFKVTQPCPLYQIQLFHKYGPMYLS